MLITSWILWRGVLTSKLSHLFCLTLSKVAFSETLSQRNWKWLRKDTNSLTIRRLKRKTDSYIFFCPKRRCNLTGQASMPMTCDLSMDSHLKKANRAIAIYEYFSTKMQRSLSSCLTSLMRKHSLHSRSHLRLKRQEINLSNVGPQMSLSIQRQAIKRQWTRQVWWQRTRSNCSFLCLTTKKASASFKACWFRERSQLFSK